MEEIKIYTNTCLTCREAKRLSMISRIAKEYGLKVRDIRTTYRDDMKQEAKEISTLPQPFIIYGTKSIQFYNTAEEDIRELIEGK